MSFGLPDWISKALWVHEAIISNHNFVHLSRFLGDYFFDYKPHNVNFFHYYFFR